jgi:hypothetical protein
MTSFVYFIKPIGMDGPIKIGCSVDPEIRLSNLMVWSPFPLEIVATIPGGYSLERNVHECFADAHSHKEWFRAIPRLQTFINGLQAGKEIGEILDLNARIGSIREPRVLSDEWRVHRRAASRVMWAKRKFMAANGHSIWTSEAVDRALAALWRAVADKTQGPSIDDLKALESFVADPGSHGLTHNQKYPDVRRIA